MNKTCSVFKIKDDKGHIKECEVLYLFTPKNSDKNYIVYTDNSVDEAGSKRVYANIYRENGEKKELLPLESEEEWFTVEQILAKLDEKSKEG